MKLFEGSTFNKKPRHSNGKQ